MFTEDQAGLGDWIPSANHKQQKGPFSGATTPRVMVSDRHWFPSPLCEKEGRGKWGEVGLSWVTSGPRGLAI